MPSFLSSVDNAFDFARTAVLLYGAGNEEVLEAADFLFGESTAGLAISDDSLQMQANPN